MGSNDTASGGFGGGGGIPLLPGDTEGAAEGEPVINYIFKGATSPFGGFGDVDSKKAATTPTTDALGAPITTDPKALPVDTSFIHNFMKESGFLLPGETKKTLSATLEGAPKGVHLPLGTSHHDTPNISFGAASMPERVSKVVTSKKVAQKRAVEQSYGAGSSGRYWRVTGTHAPGWKQIGARQPTAPGQPDRY